MKTKLDSLIKVAISNGKLLAAGLATSGLTSGIGYMTGKDESEKKDRAIKGFALGGIGTGVALVGNSYKNKLNAIEKIKNKVENMNIDPKDTLEDLKNKSNELKNLQKELNTHRYS